MNSIKQFIILFCIGMFVLTGCNSGGGLATVSDTSTKPDNNGPGETEDIGDTASIPSNLVYFQAGDDGINSLSITYLGANVANGKSWIPPTSPNAFSMFEDKSIAVIFQAQLSNDSNIGKLFRENYSGKLMMSYENGVSSPDKLFFYIVTNFFINNSPIVEYGNSNTEQFAIGEGEYWWFGEDHNWWIGTSGKKTSCGDIKVKTENGNSYYFSGVSNNKFIVSTKPSKTNCNEIN